MKRELPEAAALSHTSLYRYIARDKCRVAPGIKSDLATVNVVVRG